MIGEVVTPLRTQEITHFWSDASPFLLTGPASLLNVAGNIYVDTVTTRN